MAAPELFTAPGLRLQWQHDRWNGWRVIAWKPNASASFSEREALLKFIAWPASTPTGQLIRGWLDAQIEACAAPRGAGASPVASTALPGEGAEESPAARDPSDPTHQCRMVI
jgi:hypothetical protein